MIDSDGARTGPGGGARSAIAGDVPARSTRAPGRCAWTRRRLDPGSNIEAAVEPPEGGADSGSGE